jgi:hypothetical protein
MLHHLAVWESSLVGSEEAGQDKGHAVADVAGLEVVKAEAVRAVLSSAGISRSLVKWTAFRARNVATCRQRAQRARASAAFGVLLECLART